MKTISLFRLSAVDLSKLAVSVREETERRTRATIADAGGQIIGNEMAKRALTVAAAGKHSTLFIGNPQMGKTMFRALAAELGLLDTFESLPCPCGNRGDAFRLCECTTGKVSRMKFPMTDVTVEVCRVPEREWKQDKRHWTTAAEMRKQIEQMGARPTAYDEPCESLLKYAVNEFGLTHGRVERIREVARTIAALDHAAVVTSSHMNEAIHYRGFNQ